MTGELIGRDGKFIPGSGDQEPEELYGPPRPPYRPAPGSHQRMIDRYLANGEDCWPPHEVRLELVEGCLLRCDHCGIHGIREMQDDTLRYMQRPLWEKIAAELRERVWLSRVVLSGRGEPLLHPEFDRIVDCFRHKYGRTPVWVETSGLGLIDLRLRREVPIFISIVNRLSVLIEAGVSVITISRRRGAERVWDALDKNFDEIKDHTGALVRRGHPESSRRATGQGHIWLSQDVFRSRSLQHPNQAWNHAGAGDVKFRKRLSGDLRSPQCLRPVEEMSVRFDGRVPLCQDDWRGEMRLGDVYKQSLYDVFYSPLARAARRRLTCDGDRSLRPCSNCDHISDWGGWAKENNQRSPSRPGDRELMEEALRRGSMTKPVLRPWERG